MRSPPLSRAVTVAILAVGLMGCHWLLPYGPALPSGSEAGARGDGLGDGFAGDAAIGDGSVRSEKLPVPDQRLKRDALPSCTDAGPVASFIPLASDLSLSTSFTAFKGTCKNYSAATGIELFTVVPKCAAEWTRLTSEALWQLYQQSGGQPGGTPITASMLPSTAYFNSGYCAGTAAFLTAIQSYAKEPIDLVWHYEDHVPVSNGEKFLYWTVLYFPTRGLLVVLQGYVIQDG